MKFTVRKIAVIGIFSAIIALMTFVPFLGMIPLPFVSINLVLIPIIVVTQIEDTKTGVIISTLFGVFSMIASYVMPQTLLSFLFQNPLVSVLPRFFIGLTCGLSYKGFKKLLSKAKTKFSKDILPSAFSAFIAVTTNTVLVFASWLIFYGGTVAGDTTIGLPLIGYLIPINYLPEVTIATLMVPSLVSVISIVVKKVKESKEIDEELLRKDLMEKEKNESSLKLNDTVTEALDVQSDRKVEFDVIKKEIKEEFENSIN